MLARVMRRGGSIARAGSVLRAGALARVLVLGVGALVVGACAMQRAVEQRTTHGPTSQQMFNLRVMTQSGREPTFEEKRQWDEQTEQGISLYLRAHPEKANALDVSTFRFIRQVTVGMDKDQILILLGAPVAVTGDQAQMQQIARGYWPGIQGNATELWIYPLGWNFFFAGPRLIDITQYLPP